MLKRISLTLLLVFFSIGNAFAAEDPDAAIHQQLRDLLKQVESAINSGNYDAMLPILSENPRITPINQEYLSSREQVSRYFNKWFGKDGYLQKLEISLTPDALAELSADKTWGLIWGMGKENYILADGRTFEMHTRWTAVVVKTADNHWRIRSIHIGTNFLDNPILAMAEHSALYFGIGGLAIGLLAGFGSAWFLRRRKN
jgi:ketosteroid isomerase-like protein